MSKDQKKKVKAAKVQDKKKQKGTTLRKLEMDLKREDYRALIHHHKKLGDTVENQGRGV
jgi:hypothetical protein